MEVTNNQQIGIKLREKRRSMNLTGPQVQEATGINQGTISRIENGNLGKNNINVKKLCSFYKMTKEELYSLGIITQDSIKVSIGMVLSIESEKLKCFFVNSDIEIVDSVNTAKSHFVFTTKKELNNYYPASFLPILSLGEMCLMCKTQKFQSMKNKSGMHNFFLDLLFQMKKYNSENEESLEMFFYLEWILML